MFHIFNFQHVRLLHSYRLISIHLKKRVAKTYHTLKQTERKIHDCVCDDRSGL